jgi:hexosaminidase
VNSTSFGDEHKHGIQQHRHVKLISLTGKIAFYRRLLAFSGLLVSLAFAQDLPLMPWPASVTPQSGSVRIDGSFSVALSGEGSKDDRVTTAVNRLFVRLSRQTGIPIDRHVVNGTQSATLSIIVEQKDHRAPQRLGDDERYSLEANNAHIRLSADRPLGVLRGIDTLLQLVQQSRTPGFSIPGVSIRDEPRFPWRGLSLDVARHFMPQQEVERTLDGLSAVKLNVLHLHLSDDEGFRVESKRYPRLQQYGSDGMYYTQKQVREMVVYARERGIRIVPEFDMPGHATSWLVGYPHLGSRSGSFEITRNFDTSTNLIDPTQENTYRFLDGFIGEMAKLFPDEYFHIGGDEVNPKEWNENPRILAFMRRHHLANAKELHTYFNERLLKIVTKHHKHMEGWDEILQPDLPKSILVQSWRGQPSLWQGARQGFQGILSAGYYLDLMYPSSYHYAIDPMKAPGMAPGHEGQARPDDPKQPAPGTPSGLTQEQAKLILGGEAAMWDELATPENLDAKLWPRLAAIAERFWSPESVTDPHSMYRRLYATNEWLQWLGLTQRSNLELMRQRLAEGNRYEPLDTFASALEPVKGYSRNAETYTRFVPLNRLVDAISPESNAARQFREEVDEYLATAGTARNSRAMRDRLSDWAKAAAEVRLMGETNFLLAEDIPVADAIESLCRTALESLDDLEGKSSASARWKEQARALVAKYSYKRMGDLLVPIAPGVAKLVDAVL